MKFTGALLLTCAIFASVAHAAPADSDGVWYSGMFNLWKKIGHESTDATSGARECDNCQAAESAPSPSPAPVAPVLPPPVRIPQVSGSPACQDRYTALFSKPEIDISYAFGYYDNRPSPEVISAAPKARLIQNLTDACAAETKLNPLDTSYDYPKVNAFKNACGFTRDADDDSNFFKKVIGPDGKEHTIRLHLISAVGVDTAGDLNDDVLRKSPEQKAKSEQARTEYLHAVANDDIVIYDGHSRDGGGPDFFPPVLKPSGAVDYDWYHHNRTGLNDVLAALTATDHRPALMAFLSCASKLHFQKRIGQVSPNTALLLTNGFVAEDNTDRARDFLLDGLLGFRCDDGFVDSMESPAELYEEHPERGTVQGFDLLGWGVKTPDVPPLPIHLLPSH